MTTIIENTKHALGNSESAVVGIFPQDDGTFLAMTSTASKEYKTRKGAAKWLAARGIEVITKEESNLRRAIGFGKMARRYETAKAPCQCKFLMGMIREISEERAASGESGWFSAPLLKAWIKGFDKEHHKITNKILAEIKALY